MAYDGFLGYINEEDPVSSDVRECIDSFLVLTKEDQNTYFSMYENNLDYSEKKDEFDKIKSYHMTDWIKTAISHIKGFDKDDCTNYALSKSVANINSIKITSENKESKKESIVYDPGIRYKVYSYKTDDKTLTVYSDGSIEDEGSGKVIAADQLKDVITELREAIHDTTVNKDNEDKKKFEYIDNKANKPEYEEKPKDDTSSEESSTFEIVDELSNTNSDNLIEIEKVDDDETVYKAQGRSGYLSWNEAFMQVAEVFSKRSKDPVTQVGACLVKNNRIISTGYNGMPYSKKVNNDKAYPWNTSVSGDKKLDKRSYVVHAELNAILNARQSVEGSTLYCTLFPCNECAKAIVQAGIKKIYYKEKDNKEIYDIAEELMDNAGIEINKM